MHVVISSVSSLHGSLTIPPDKAICHRAVIAAACAAGDTTIAPWPLADDCQRTRAVIEQLGVRTRASSEGLEISGSGGQGLRAPASDLMCGESGTTLRIAAGLLAGQSYRSTLTAGPSLSRRPMQRIVEPLSLMGAQIEGRASSSSRECYPPLVIQGRRPLAAIGYTLPVASAQVKSAILFAGLFADGRTIVTEQVKTRDHTERVLRHFGAAVREEGRGVSLEPCELTAPGRLELPGDFSSAAFFIVAACCVPGASVTLHNVSLNPTRLGLLAVLERMGASIDVTEGATHWEPRGTITVKAARLQGTSVAARDVPGIIDELPVLMTAAACAQGVTRLTGMGELRVKETDRVQSMVSGLQALGVRVRVPAPDTVEIEGGRLAGAAVESAGDHRTAMSLAVAALVAKGSTRIRGAECVAKSYPEFFDHLRLLVGASTVQNV